MVTWRTLAGALCLAACFETQALSLPPDSQLEAEGARIGTVNVRVKSIFDPSRPGENRYLFKLADRLHADTREDTVRSHLLFAQGDLYSHRLLSETARNLRGLRFIREPDVRAVAYHDGVVDIDVIVQDIWTTNPGASFGHAGGASSSGFEFEDLNLLGFGKQVSLGYESNTDRSSYTLGWRDPSILGSRWQSEVAFVQSDDGDGKRLGIERPFYSLDSRWAAGVTAETDKGINGVYALGERVSDYGFDYRKIDAHVGWSRGLHDGWTRRWIAGFREDHALFTGTSSPWPTVSPHDRRLDYPYVRFEAIEDDFETTRNQDRIATTEDQEFGKHFMVELGQALPSLGSDRSATLFRAEAGRGLRLAPMHSLFLSSALSGRLEGGAAADAIVETNASYRWRTGSRSLFFASLSGAAGKNLDVDRELLLDGATGLRGYPLRYQSGTARALLTLEQRVYTDWTLWHIAQIGGAVFFDNGRTWGQSAGGGPSQGLLSDVGFGLRLGSLRDSRANVLHIDLAFPLNGTSSLSNMQFLVETKRSF